jgi:ABC-type transporter Mla subunit MlaD
MIDWQKEYKDSVQKFEEQLKLTVENVNTSHQNTTNLIEVFAEDIGKSLSDNREQNQAFNELAEKQLESLLSQTETALSTMQENVKQIESITANYQIIGEVSKNLEQVIATNQNQIQNIETHLQTLTELGNNAQKFTEQTSEFMTGLKNQLQEYTTNIEEQLPKSLDRLNEALTSLTRQFSEDYETFLNTLNQLTGNRSGSGTPSNQNRNRQIDTS